MHSRGNKMMPHSYSLCFTQFVILCVITFAWLSVAKADISADRTLYKQADTALTKKQYKQYLKYEQQLVQYPLYPYLRYRYLNAHLNTVKPQYITAFLESSTDLPVATKLRKRWLKQLAKRHQWSDVVQNYVPQLDVALRCTYLKARSKLAMSRDLLLEIRDEWLVGKSLPDECDPIFEILYNSDLMDDDLVWQRIQLSIKNNQFGLAKFLAKKLKTKYITAFQNWQSAHQNPSEWLKRSLKKPRSKRSEIEKDIALYSLKKLARQDLKQSLKYWKAMQQHRSFSEQQIGLLNKYLALQAFRKDDKDTLKLLDAVPHTVLDKPLFTAKVKTALKTKDWDRLLRWLDASPPADDAIKNAWFYWKGRALQKKGNLDEARQAFSQIKNERDYYGFLAADNLQTGYGINHSSIRSKESIRTAIDESPAMLRIKEFLALNRRTDAVREWHWMIKNMKPEQLEQAALLASELHWNDRVIVTLGRAKRYDDLNLRFPLNYEKQLKWYSDKYKMDLSWVFALIRSESAFVETARSPAGALGLMQVMPATARETAKKLGWKRFKPKMLLTADNNIPIGSAYLDNMLRKFDNNLILATAAYNAGPHRVKQWLADTGCVEPDVWVELIPYKETRQYVKRILYYSNIYDWRFNQTLVPISKRMSMTTPMNKQELTSSFSCNNELVSLH